MNENNTTTIQDQKEEGSGEWAINYTVDSYANGIAFGQHRLDAGRDPRECYALRLLDDANLVRLRGRYMLEKANPLHELERALMRLSNQGVLHDATIYFGVSTDPFLPFDSKFDASMKFLDLFQRYTPGMLVIQTRSPLIVLALPVFKRLGKHAAVTIGIETPLEEMARAYTPALPRVEERLRTAEALRKFGVEVTLQVGPVLPYGDWREDAGRFAEVLIEHADFICVQPLTDGTEYFERKMRSSELVRKLAHDRRFHYLRKDAGVPLLNAIDARAPEKLAMPRRAHLDSKQIKIFAA